MDIKFRIPDSRTMSLRLNRAEEDVLTDAAQFHGIKLSTYIKREALRSANKPQFKVEGIPEPATYTA